MSRKTRILVYILIAAAAVVIGIISMLSVKSEKPSAQSHIDLGYSYLVKLSYSKAVIEFTDAIDIDPYDPEGYLGLAEAYVNQNLPEKAIEILRIGLDETNDDRIRLKLEMLISRREEELNETQAVKAPDDIKPVSKTTVPATVSSAPITGSDDSVTDTQNPVTENTDTETTPTINKTETSVAEITTIQSEISETSELNETTSETTIFETTEKITEEPEIDFYEIAEKYVNDSESAEKIVSIEQADYDNDGKNEAFFVEQSKVNSWGNRTFGTHYINSDSEIIDLASFDNDVYDLYSVTTYEYKNYKFFCVERCYNGEATDTAIYTVKNGNWHRPNISGNIRLFSVNNNVISCEKKGDYVNGKREYIKTKLAFDEETCEFFYAEK